MFSWPPLLWATYPQPTPWLSAQVGAFNFPRVKHKCRSIPPQNDMKWAPSLYPTKRNHPTTLHHVKHPFQLPKEFVSLPELLPPFHLGMSSLDYWYDWSGVHAKSPLSSCFSSTSCFVDPIFVIRYIRDPVLFKVKFGVCLFFLILSLDHGVWLFQWRPVRRPVETPVWTDHFIATIQVLFLLWCFPALCYLLLALVALLSYTFMGWWFVKLPFFILFCFHHNLPPGGNTLKFLFANTRHSRLPSIYRR